MDANQTAVPTGNQEVQSQTPLVSLATQQKTVQTVDQELLMIALQGPMTIELKDVSGPISHVTARVSQTVQPKRAGQTSILMETETLLRDHLTLETQEHLNLEAMNQEAVKPEDHASLLGHLIVATIVASAPIVQPEISAVIPSADLETHLEILQELTSHVQTQESMTAIVTLTAKTESQETSPATPASLALATKTQTAKHSLRTRF
jgi:hypothetical protein